VNIGDPSLESAIGQVITNLSSGGSIPVSLAGGNSLGSTVIPITSSAPSTSSGIFDNVNWTLLGIIGAGTAVVIAAFFFFGGHRK
jgi:hypothetical protein